MPEPIRDGNHPAPAFRNAFAVAALAAVIVLAGCKQDEAAAPGAVPGTTEGSSAVAAPAPAPAPVAARPAPAPCYNCGVITKIDKKKKRGKATGLGIVTGALVGGVAGHNIGHGDSATAAGAIVGGIAGNEIEKQARSKYYYRVSVRLTGGDVRRLDMGSAEGLYVGQKVKVEGGDIVVR
jgi:uncharacterized protein YcfJ